jgi:hypothetical protein
VVETLVWPLFVAAVVLWARKPVRDILRAIADRIAAGGVLEAGPSGVKLGPLPPTTGGGEAPSSKSATSAQTRSPDGEPSSSGKTLTPRGARDTGPDNPGIYLVHKARRDPALDRDLRSYYRLRIFLETDPDVGLDCVERVRYHLHPDFQDPIREARDPGSQFAIRTWAWGQFNMTAEVFLKGASTPLVLERYLNF